MTCSSKKPRFLTKFEPNHVFIVTKMAKDFPRDSYGRFAPYKERENDEEVDEEVDDDVEEDFHEVEEGHGEDGLDEFVVEDEVKNPSKKPIPTRKWRVRHKIKSPIPMKNRRMCRINKIQQQNSC